MAKSGVTQVIRDVDLGLIAIMKKMNKEDDVDVLVGIFGAGGIATYATVHEFGGQYHRERSFLRSTMDRNQTKYFDRMAKGAGRVMAGQTTLRAVLNTLGLVVAGEVKRTVTSLQLIDTGALRNAISHDLK